MKNRSLLTTGLIGTAISAICCFTPTLVLVFTALGLSGVISMLDYILLPSLAIFLCITGYALWNLKKSKSS